MAATAGTLRAIIQRRVRDPNGTMHTNAFTLDILSRAQRLVNASAQIVLQTETLTTAAYKAVYEVDIDLTTAIDIVGVRDGNKDLDEVSLAELQILDPSWFRRVGPAFELYARIGRTLFILYPAKSAASSVSVISSKLTVDLAADGTALEIETDRDSLVTDMAEIMLLIRQRDLEQAQDALRRFTPRFQAARQMAISS